MSGVPPIRSTIDSAVSVRSPLIGTRSQRERLLDGAQREERRLLDAGVARRHIADFDAYERIERARRRRDLLRRHHDGSDAGGREVERLHVARRRHRRRAQLLLTGAADFRQHDLARVATDLLVGKTHAQPPAIAGTIETSSLSPSGVSRFCKKRMSSSLTKMLTKRRTEPLSSQMRSLMPGYFFSSSPMSSPTDLPEAWTSSAPPVSLRSGVGMRTMAMVSLLLVALTGPSRIRRCAARSPAAAAGRR